MDENFGGANVNEILKSKKNKSLILLRCVQLLIVNILRT